MKAVDILLLYLQNYPNYKNDVRSANRLASNGQPNNAGERCRSIGRKLLSQKLYTHALEHYNQATDYFINASSYLKAVGTQRTVYEINKLISNKDGMAKAQEVIAACHMTMGDLSLAGEFYTQAAMTHEDNQNYPLAFNNARTACKLLENTLDPERKKTAHGMAFRSALRCGYYERAGIYAERWLLLQPKDYSPHYLAICLKGYKSFIQANLPTRAIYFIDELIIAHFDHQISQDRIEKYIEDGIKIRMASQKIVHQPYVTNMLTILEGRPIDELLIFYVEMKNYASSIGLTKIADMFYLYEMEARRHSYTGFKNFISRIGYRMWNITSLYGLSLGRWMLSSLAIIFVFGLLYMPWNIITDTNSTLYKLGAPIKPSIHVTTVSTWFSPWYYSVVTFATLGYGDITPSDVSGQIFCVIEVILGYLMLGGLLSIFGKKMIR